MKKRLLQQILIFTSVAFSAAVIMITAKAVSSLFTDYTESDEICVSFVCETFSREEMTEEASEETIPADKESVEIIASDFSKIKDKSNPEIYVINQTDYYVDTEKILSESTAFSTITGKEPTVLIYHTHGTEAYAEGDTYTEGESFRSVDAAKSVIAIGEELKKSLAGYGIVALHDTALYDADGLSGAYSLSKKSVKEYMEKYPTIKYVFDIHRDSISKNGREVKAVTEINGVLAAQIMIVVGSDVNNGTHLKWKSNFACAVKLQETANSLYPSLMRPIYLRTSSFNQEVSETALLFEIGTEANTIDEAIAAVRLLAEVICDTYK